MYIQKGSLCYQRLLPCMICLLIILTGNISKMTAQPVIGAENLAMGGGGTAYLSGAETNFYNPANLMIYDRTGNFHLTFGNTGAFFEPVLSTNKPGEQIQKFRDIYTVYQQNDLTLTAGEKQTLLNENYPRSRLVSQHQSRADILHGGIHWQRDKSSFSLAARSRIATRIEVGRGWYFSDYVENGSRELRDFTLVRQNQTLHELSFGYAREFEIINGLIPRLDHLYIGIAPKFIVGGAYNNSAFDARYINSENGQNSRFVQQFTHQSTGSYSDMITDYRLGSSPSESIAQNMDNRFFVDPTGYGFGVDFGFSYVFPLESNAAILDTGDNRRPVKQSLRFAFSITDIGFINYDTSPLQLSSPADTTTNVAQENTLNTKFVGSVGQYLSVFDNTDAIENPLTNASDVSQKNFSKLLPTTLNSGILLDLNWLKFAGDLTLGLNNSSFKSTKLTAHFGLEVRPHPKIPVRTGTQLAAGLPIHFGLGTGIETKNWDFFISGQLLVKSTLTTDLTGGGVTGLQFHF